MPGIVHAAYGQMQGRLQPTGSDIRQASHGGKSQRKGVAWEAVSKGSAARRHKPGENKLPGQYQSQRIMSGSSRFHPPSSLLGVTGGKYMLFYFYPH